MKIWLAAAEAVRMLGIKRETLYAYASRGKVRTQQLGRAKRYLHSDLERLRARQRARAGHGAVAAGALRWGEPVLDSRITEIRSDGHRYRGVPALRLAATSSLEGAAELLWEAEWFGEGEHDGHLWPGAIWPVAPGKLAAIIGAHARPIDVLAIAVPAVAVHDAQRLQVRHATTVRVGRRLLRLMAASLALPRGAMAARDALGQASLARTLLNAFRVRPRAAALRAVSTSLVLCADHGLNPSSFAARVAASAGADVYACVSAALATLSGPRHGGMPARVRSLIDDIARPSRTARVLGERLQRGDDIPGFGHTLYPDGDPRFAPLLRVALQAAPRSRAVAIVESLVETMKLTGGQLPTVDMGLAAVAAALGLPHGGATALFAVGRAAGWIAQMFEQRQAGYLLRPRARYVGPG